VPSGEVEAPASAEIVSAVASRAQVARILESRHFAKAERLKRFLRFVTEETLKGLSNAIKETVIGIEVFDRSATTFDPRTDPIVRVQAGRVRAKLADYYAQDGANDRVLVDLPRGQYVPRFSMQSTASGRALRAPANGEPPALQSNTIAVLPFVNISADPADDYFSDGLTEELVNALARLPSVRITARRSAFRFTRTDRDIREIGRLLGAGKIVKGSVRIADDRLRITVQLVNVADGCQLWSEKYDRTMDDVFALQEEIAGSIRLALRGVLGGAQAPRAEPPTRSVSALNQYLLGRFHWNKRDEAGLRAALAHFRGAIQIDPDYGRALSGVADCYIMLAMSGAEAPAACMPPAEQAALRALEIDDRLVEAHTSLGVVRAGLYWDWNGSEIEFQRALESDASYATLHHWYSIYSLAPLGRFDEAEDEIEWAEQLDPTSLTINLGHAQTLYLAGDCPAAIAQCTSVLRLDGRYYRAYWWQGLAHNRLGNYEAASDALETARARGGGEIAFRARILGALGHTYGRWGKSDRAMAVLDELAALSRLNYVDPFEIAHVQAGLGKMDAAVDSLERAAADRSGWLMYCGVWPAFESLRQNTRFRALLSRMALGGAGHVST
jgi:TolB-like protein/tetratricopeptide (TPR) repeat protein